MWPIISTIGSPNYRLAKELARILTPLTGKRTPQNLYVCWRMSLSGLQISWLVLTSPVCSPWYDLTMLSWWRHRSWLRTRPSNKEPLSLWQLVQLTECCLCLTYFKIHQFYEQTDGAAMGSPFLPPLSIYSWSTSKRAMQSTHSPPSLWTCYGDDTFVIWQHGGDELPKLHQHLNQHSPNIQFTMERKKDRRIIFLDVMVKWVRDHLSASVYHKPTHTDGYPFLPPP